MDDLIKEIEKLFKYYNDNTEIVKISDSEYRIQSRIRDLKFVYNIFTQKLTYKVQCYHIDDFTFIDSDTLGRMIMNFRALQEISEQLEVLLKKYK